MEELISLKSKIKKDFFVRVLIDGNMFFNNTDKILGVGTMQIHIFSTLEDHLRQI